CRADVVDPYCRRERRWIIRLGSDNARILGLYVIRMYEIHRWVHWQIAEDRRRFANVELVPAHVREFEAGNRIEAHDLAGEQGHTLIHTVLVTGREQKLQPQADAQEWLALVDVVFDRLDEIRFPQARDGITKRADAGEDELFRLGNAIRIVADDGRRPDLLKRLLHP